MSNLSTLYSLKADLTEVLDKATKYDHLCFHARAIKPALEAMYEQQPLAIQQSYFWISLRQILIASGESNG